MYLYKYKNIEFPFQMFVAETNGESTILYIIKIIDFMTFIRICIYKTAKVLKKKEIYLRIYILNLK